MKNGKINMEFHAKIAGWAAVFLFLPVFLLAYSPAVFNHYAHHDDFTFLIRRKDGFFLQHEIMLASGRIGRGLDCLSFKGFDRPGA